VTNAITYDSLKLEAPAADAQHQAFERRQQRRADRLNEVPETVSSSRAQQIERDLLGDQAIDPADHTGALAPQLLITNSVEMALIKRPRARGRRADASSAISN
jgi:hypothetical protein